MDWMADFQRRISEQIPIIGQGMHISLLSVSDEKVVAQLPFAGNANDKGTAFAGSLFSLAVVSGWCLVTARAYACGFERPWAAVVRSECNFQKAVRDDAQAVAVFTEPANPVVGARNWLHVEVRIGDEVCFRGEYAVGQHQTR